MISSESELSVGYGMRRSTRRKKLPGERAFIVSSDMILRDLKVKVSSRDILVKLGLF